MNRLIHKNQKKKKKQKNCKFFIIIQKKAGKIIIKTSDQFQLR